MRQDRLKDFLEAQMKLKDVKGASLIIQEDAQSSIYHYGESDTGVQVHDDSLFQIGSLSKIFTALLVINFIKKGDLSVATALGEILPESNIEDSFKSITILELLTHTSGLPRLPDNFMASCINQDDPYLYYGETELLEYLQSGKLKKTGEMLYSNLGYGLLGFILEKLTKQKYEDLLYSVVVQPLGLQQTFAYNSGHQYNPSKFKGYNAKNISVQAWDMNVMKGAGCIVSSPHDMKIFLASILKSNSQIEDIISQSLQPINKRMAWGWFKKDLLYQLQTSGSTLWHNGMTGGFSSYMQINRQNQNGFIILMNKSIGTEFIVPQINHLLKITHAVTEQTNYNL